MLRGCVAICSSCLLTVRGMRLLFMQGSAAALTAAEQDRAMLHASAAGGMERSGSQAVQLRDTTQGRLEHRLDQDNGSTSKEGAAQELPHASSYGPWIHDSSALGGLQKAPAAPIAHVSAWGSTLQQPRT